MRAFLVRRGFLLAMGAGLLLAVAPLCTTRVLPFHDASGIVGLGGALALRDDPTAHVRAFYDLDIRAYPSALYFAWAWLTGALHVPMEIGFSIFTALFSLAGPPLALWFLLISFRRPRLLALLAFPISYHHQIWFGFLGSSAAIAGLLLALAFARRLYDRSTWRDHLGLAVSLMYVAAAHPFPLALTLAVVAPLVLWPPANAGGVRALLLRYAARLGTFAPMGLFLAGWFASFFAHRTGGATLGHRLSTELRLFAPRPDDAWQFVQWLGNGYRSSWDELVPLVALATLVALLIFGIAADAPDRPAGLWGPALRQRDGRALLRAAHASIDGAGLGWAALVLGLGYLLLPMKLMWPEFWWGVRVRCVVPFYLVTVALVRPRRRGLPPWTLGPALVAAAVLLVFITQDLAGSWRRRLDGFDEALAAIPPGQSVQAFTALPDPRYSEGHPYIVQHYVARKGGRAIPYLHGHPGSYWITLKPPPPTPDWGDPRQFVWSEHAAGYDYFLEELPLEGPSADPMRDAPRDAVGEVLARGHWVLWRRLP